MDKIIPYLVLVLVILIFFAICYKLFNTSSDNKKKEDAIRISPIDSKHGHSKHSRKVDYGEAYYSEEQEENKTIKENQDVKLGEDIKNNEDIKNDTIIVDNKDQSSTEDIDKTAGLSPVETEVAAPKHNDTKLDVDTEKSANLVNTSDATMMVDTASVKQATCIIPNVRSEAKTDSAEKTMMIPSVSESDSSMEATRVISAAEMLEAIPVGAKPSLEEAEKYIPQEGKNYILEEAMAPFVKSFGLISGPTRVAVEEITQEALHRLDVTDLEEVKVLLENIVVQEAMMCMQKAYAATPRDWMKSAALESFLDVVQEPKSSTPYLVAFDALRILPHFTLGHFQVLALALLLQYSRNSNNYSLHYFQHYVEKYIEPFISDIPHDDSIFRQLEYLRCCMQEREQITFAQLLSNSYPYVFNYRGFNKEELERAMGGERIAPRFIVRSMNSSLYKLAIVDESMAQRLFRQAHISDPETKRRLLALMKSKPTSFSGAEARNIMEEISPVLADLAEIFDNGAMSRMSMTLLGLYLGRAHVKATIGEEFDLSHWF